MGGEGEVDVEVPARVPPARVPVNLQPEACVPVDPVDRLGQTDFRRHTLILPSFVSPRSKSTRCKPGESKIGA